MIANVESIEVLLQVSFGRGIKYLSATGQEPQNEQLLQLGEKLSAASLKCFIVRAWLSDDSNDLTSDRGGFSMLNLNLKGCRRSSGIFDP